MTAPIRKTLVALLALTALCYVSSCEKDDICVDGDTPLLVIGFFDSVNTAEAKSVPALRIRALDNDGILNDTESFRFTDRGNSPDSIFIPLRTAASNTQFEFITDSADDDSGNESGNSDTLDFTYVINEVFISRACGFVANFNALESQLVAMGDNWIDSIAVVQPNVERTNMIHVQIFH